MRGQRIGAYAQHDDSPFLHLMIGIAERTRLSSAAGGIILWVEIQHDRPPPQFAQMYLAVFHYVIASYRGKRKVRSGLVLLYLDIIHNTLL